MDELLRAPSLDLQADAALLCNTLSIIVPAICCHCGGATGQHGDFQNVPFALGFGSEGAVQQQLVRCELDGTQILLHCRPDDLAGCLALRCCKL
eukprot:1169958-Amphidinium_carterae.1